MERFLPPPGCSCNSKTPGEEGLSNSGSISCDKNKIRITYELCRLDTQHIKNQFGAGLKMLILTKKRLSCFNVKTNCFIFKNLISLVRLQIVSSLG